MDLVTVTWSSDLNFLKLQSFSINKFIQTPCVHWVIIEDDVINIDQWRQEIGSYYQNHTLKLIHHSEISSNKNNRGWIRQQVLKLQIAQYIESKSYLILDSKNFFINPTDLNDWPIVEGNGSLHFDLSEHPSWEEWVDYCALQTELNKPKIFWAPETPFRVDTSIVKEILKLDIDNMFNNCENPSEFLLYRFFSQTSIRAQERIVYTLWPGTTPPNIEILEEERKNVIMFSLHKRFIKENLLSFSIIADWLKRIGFPELLVSNLSTRLKIKVSGGIGDCLRYISLNSGLITYFDKFGIKVYWTYQRDITDLYVTEAIIPLFDHCPYLEYIPEENFDSLDAVPIYPNADYYVRNQTNNIKINLSQKETEELISIQNNSKIKIVVQFFGSKLTKDYFKYKSVFEILLNKYSEATIFLVDAPGVVIDDCVFFDKRIVSLIGKINLAQTVHLIQQADYFIGPDSYGKYVCTWNNTKATILCSKVNKYNDINLLTDCFYGYKNNIGLCFNPNIKLLGVQYSGDNNQVKDVQFIKNINELTPEEIADSVKI